MSRRVVALTLIGLLFPALAVTAAAPAPLKVEAKIPLGDVRGRLDHLAIDLARERIYVAELGNNSIGIVDLRQRKLVRTLGGLREPQGIGYEPTTDTLYVANAGDGSVHVYSASDLSLLDRIALGEDADNVRIDEPAHRVWVGYGSGALAAIDPVGRRVTVNIPLPAHPESFRRKHDDSLIFVNIPEAGEIAVVDPGSQRQVASWKTGHLHGNFPMALDDAHHVLVVFRRPAQLTIYRENGRPLQSLETCSDADDIFFNARRGQVYVTCGQGYVDVFRREGPSYRTAGRLPTALGARTSLFVPGLDRLFVAVRATLTTPAAIWVIRPISADQ